jgi:hypothetical protein
MAQATVDESASVSMEHSATARAPKSGPKAAPKSRQMVQGAKPEPQEPQMGSTVSLFTDWASI